MLDRLRNLFGPPLSRRWLACVEAEMIWLDDIGFRVTERHSFVQGCSITYERPDAGIDLSYEPDGTGDFSVSLWTGSRDNRSSLWHLLALAPRASLPDLRPRTATEVVTSVAEVSDLLERIVPAFLSRSGGR